MRHLSTFRAAARKIINAGFVETRQMEGRDWQWKGVGEMEVDVNAFREELLGPMCNYARKFKKLIKKGKGER